MNVKKLIEVLSKLDQNKEILVDDGEGYMDYPINEIVLVDNDYYRISVL